MTDDIASATGGENNANACADQGIDAYIATGRLPTASPPAENADR